MGTYTGPELDGVPWTGLVTGVSSGLIDGLLSVGLDETGLLATGLSTGLSIGRVDTGRALSGLDCPEGVDSSKPSVGCGVLALHISRPLSRIAWRRGMGVFKGLYCTKKRTAIAGPGWIFIFVFSILKSILSVVVTSPTQF